MTNQKPKPLSLEQIEESYKLIEGQRWDQLDAWLADRALSDPFRSKVMDIARRRPVSMNWKRLMWAHNERVMLSRRLRRMGVAIAASGLVAGAALLAWRATS